MKTLLATFLLLISFLSNAQVKGAVTDDKGNPLPFVSILIENTYTGTTSNEKGHYVLNVKQPGEYVIIFQYLGFKTKRIPLSITQTLQTLDVSLLEENITLKEVVINTNDNPANEVIQKAIAAKKDNAESTQKYRADFYSRGIFRIKDAPKKIMGQKFDAFDEVLDSSRSGILYLSETVSKIVFQKPDKLKETIIASKVSGNDNGFSFNNAASANFDFYDNYLVLQTNVISPIANNAFSYYKYKLEGTFFDENQHQINKIKVIPKRTSEPVMEGYLYIVEDSWAIYAVDLSIKGSQMQMPTLNSLALKQSFSYNRANNLWIKNTQTLDFIAGILGINMSGRFTYVYSNYEFEPKFSQKTFGRELLSFETNANKKDSLFWNQIRPVPLTSEESNDYLKKDLLQTKKKSKTYLDSIDRKSNTLGAFDFIMGYEYSNSYKKWNLKYNGLWKGIRFNTVQGCTVNTTVTFSKRKEETRTFWELKSNFDYGFSEKKWRATLSYTNKFNAFNQSELRIYGGSAVKQFNPNNPISPLINSVSTLFFKNNFMKLYENNFAALFFTREITNGIQVDATLDYSERKPLSNTTDFTLVKKDKFYTSNNPLLPFDTSTPVFDKHNLVKASFLTRLNFGQQYWTRPDGKFNIKNEKYPELYLGYEKGFSASDKKYEFERLFGRMAYDITLGNKGVLGMNFKAGKFFNAATIAFADYKHFDGNQTHIGKSDRYLNVYNLLPYYASSTNDSYIEFHAEHQDNGFIMNKIPLLKKLQSTLVLGYHNLSIPRRSPYHEYTVGLDNLGFGKLKVFRIDYVHSYQNGTQGNGVVFGLKILNFLE